MDVAFLTELVQTGAVLPLSGGKTANALASRLTELASAERRDHWLPDGVPLLSRGAA